MFLTHGECEEARRSLRRKEDWPYLPTLEHPWYGRPQLSGPVSQGCPFVRKRVKRLPLPDSYASTRPHLDPVGAMSQPVKDAVGQCRIADLLEPSQRWNRGNNLPNRKTVVSAMARSAAERTQEEQRQQEVKPGSSLGFSRTLPSALRASNPVIDQGTRRTAHLRCKIPQASTRLWDCFGPKPLTASCNQLRIEKSSDLFLDATSAHNVSCCHCPLVSVTPNVTQI
jgi:hypothetical protein